MELEYWGGDQLQALHACARAEQRGRTLRCERREPRPRFCKACCLWLLCDHGVQATMNLGSRALARIHDCKRFMPVPKLSKMATARIVSGEFKPALSLRILSV